MMTEGDEEICISGMNEYKAFQSQMGERKDKHTPKNVPEAA